MGGTHHDKYDKWLVSTLTDLGSVALLQTNNRFSGNPVNTGDKQKIDTYSNKVSEEQCDHIGRFIGLWATF